MTALPCPAPFIPAPLDAIIRPALDALPANPAASAEAVAAQRHAALAAVVELEPQDAEEAMLAVRATAAHYAVMDAFRQAMLPDVPAALAIRLRNNAVALTRMINATDAGAEAIAGRAPGARAAVLGEGGPQPVRPAGDPRCTGSGQDR